MSDLDAYRIQVRAWLAGHAAEYGVEARRGLSEADDLALARRWQRIKYDAGYVGISWPQAYGGAGLSELHQAVFGEEEAKFNFGTSYFGISLGQPIPILLKYAPEDIRQRFAHPALKGEEIWCQLFSEPAAGSDLAGVRLKAVRDGDNWVLTGQKLWTSWAQYADYGVIVARSDPTVAKHKGLTYFWLDMKSPGITVRPVRLANGEHDVNEVFFDEVRVPDSQRLGPVGGGFGVAIDTLMIERYAAADEAGFGPTLDAFVARAKATTINGEPAIRDGRTRREIANAFRQQRALVAIRTKTFLALQQGAEPGAEGSIHKLVSMRLRQKLSAAAMDLEGAAGVELDRHAFPKDDWAHSWLTVPTLRIAGGADEMLLNTIAERLLGLPQDYRPDKAVPFDQIQPSR
ncbi:MAG: acyl-CoA dehydrogenase [Alphaproteobacteria bacterium HGW-Alphaproteobacteria-16]|nr:MAG: acyl-CoA dehydrogenase [Alphaproteobacteria bacterium HGW-Alphaproteobacteria-16]